MAVNDFPGVGDAAHTQYEEMKRRLQMTTGNQPVTTLQEEDEQIEPSIYAELLSEIENPSTETTPVDPKDLPYTPSPASSEQSNVQMEAPEGEVAPEVYRGLFEESLLGLSEEEQKKMLYDITPNEEGIMPETYGELLNEADPYGSMKINLDGLTVDNVFETNEEWRQSLIPGPTGMEYAVDLTKGIWNGINDGLTEIGSFIGMDKVYGKIFSVSSDSYYNSDLNFETETVVGDVASSLSRFLTGYAVTAPVGWLRNAYGATSAVSRYLVDGLIRGTMGDMLVANKDDQTVIGLIAPESDNIIIQSLRVDPDDSEMSAKFAVAVEGAVLGAAVQGIFDTARYGYRTVRNVELRTALDEAFTLSDDMFNPIPNPRLEPEAHRVTEEFRRGMPTGQAIMSDIQQGNAIRTVDEKMRLLEIRKQEHAVKETRLSFKERNKVRTEAKNFLNVAERDLKQITGQIKEQKTVIEKLVEELDRHLEYAKNVGGIKGIVDDVPAERAIKEQIRQDVSATEALDVYEPIPKDVPPETLLPQRGGTPDVETTWVDQFQKLNSRIRSEEDKLRVMLDNHDATTSNILESKYLIREIADEVQLEAAVRKGMAVRLDLTPRYSQIDPLDEIPMAAKMSDEELLALQTKHKVDGSFTLLGTESAKTARVPKNTSRGAAAKLAGKADEVEDARAGRTIDTRPIPATAWDSTVEDLFYKPRSTNIGDKILNRIRGAGSYYFYRSTDKLKSIAEVSPTAAKLANMMRHDAVHMGPEAGQYSYTESARYMTGKFRTKLRDTIAQLDDKHKTYRGKLTPEANKSLYNYLNGINMEEVPEDIAAIGKNLRTILDEFHAQIEEFSPYVENFFPRKYNRRTLSKNREEFRKLLALDGYTDKVRQNEIIDKIEGEIKADLNIGNLQDAPGKRFAMRGSKILSGGARTLDLTVENYSDFVDTDVLRVLNTYVETGAPKITYHQMFGYGGEKAEAMLETIQKEAAEAGRSLRADEVDTISRILQNIQGLRKLKNPYVQGTQEGISTAMRVTLLNLATLSSLGEAFIPFSKATIRDSVGGLLQAMSSAPKHYFGKALRGQPEAAAYEAAQAVGLATDYAAATRLNNILGGGEILTGINQKINNAYFMANLLTEWVKFVQVSAFHTGRLKAINNLKAIQRWGEGSVVANHRAKELLEMGISVDDGLVWLSKGADVKDPFYVQIQRGALRFVEDTVIHPDATVKPGIQNSPYTMLLTQLKSYPTAFANIVLRDWGEGIFRPWVNIGQDAVEGQLTKETLKNEAFSSASKAARVATAVPLMYGATYAGLEIKDLIKWGIAGNPNKPEKNEDEKFWDVLDVSGMLGHSAAIKHGHDASLYKQDPIYSWLGPAPNIGLKVVGSTFEEEPGSIRDALAKEASNLTRLPLPAEILWSLALPDGTEQWRRNFKQWLASPELAPEDFDPMEFVPTEIKPLLSDWEPWDFARRLYQPDKTMEQFMGQEDSEDDEVRRSVEEWKFGTSDEEKAARRRELLRARAAAGKVKINDGEE